jgi:GNAT superfamily N-acetyltransferase
MKWNDGLYVSRLVTRVKARAALGLETRSVRIGLRRDLSAPWDPPSAKIPIEVRPLERNDLKLLLAPSKAGDATEYLELSWRQEYVNAHLDRGWVAVDSRTDAPCYVQWLLGASQNDFIRRLGTFPELGEDEALLENAYTAVSHRGLGIMSAAMARIAERAVGLDARFVLTFVGEDNVASLKGCSRAGFFPYMVHRKVQRLYGFHEHNSFELIKPDDRARPPQ